MSDMMRDKKTIIKRQRAIQQPQKQRIDKEKLKTFLEEKGFKLDPKILDQIVLALNIERREDDPIPAFLLLGPPGSGKSTLPKLLSEFLDAEFYIMPITPGMSEEDLLFSIIPDETTKSGFRLVERPLLQVLERSLEKPVVFLVDEIDKANPKVDAFFLTYLQDALINLGVKGDKKGVIKGDKNNIIVFFTSNEMRELQEPLKRRLITINMPAMSTYLVYTLLTENNIDHDIAGLVSELYNVMLKLRNEDRIMKNPSYNEAFQLARMLQTIKNQQGEIPYNELTSLFYSTMVKDPESLETILSYMRSEEYEKEKGEWIMQTGMKMPDIDLELILPSKITLTTHDLIEEAQKRSLKLPEITIEKEAYQKEAETIELSDEEKENYPIITTTVPGENKYLTIILNDRLPINKIRVSKDLMVLDTILKNAEANYLLEPQAIKSFYAGFSIPFVLTETDMESPVNPQKIITLVYNANNNGAKVKVNKDFMENGVRDILIYSTPEIRKEFGYPETGLDYKIRINSDEGIIKASFRYKGTFEKDPSTRERKLAEITKTIWDTLYRTMTSIFPEAYTDIRDLLNSSKYNIIQRSLSHTISAITRELLEDEEPLSMKEYEELTDALTLYTANLTELQTSFYDTLVQQVKDTGNITIQGMTKALRDSLKQYLKTLKMSDIEDILKKRLGEEKGRRVKEKLDNIITDLSNLVENTETYLPRTEVKEVIDTIKVLDEYLEDGLIEAMKDTATTLYYIMKRNNTQNIILKPPEAYNDTNMKNAVKNIFPLFTIIYNIPIQEEGEQDEMGMIINRQDLEKYITDILEKIETEENEENPTINENEENLTEYPNQ